MRNMMQLLGGVVVAGAVAAGATAFTGAGVTLSGLNGATASKFVGGQIGQTVTGAIVTDVVYSLDSTDKSKIMYVNATLTTQAGADLTSTEAGVTLTATGGSGDAAATVTCADQGSGVWKCADATPTKYWKGISGISLVVTPV